MISFKILASWYKIFIVTIIIILKTIVKNINHG